jgi:hypothetical protein
MEAAKWRRLVPKGGALFTATSRFRGLASAMRAKLVNPAATRLLDRTKPNKSKKILLKLQIGKKGTYLQKVLELDEDN